jgi:hypothetical protein
MKEKMLRKRGDESDGEWILYVVMVFNAEWCSRLNLVSALMRGVKT